MIVVRVPSLSRKGLLHNINQRIATQMHTAGVPGAVTRVTIVCDCERFSMAPHDAKTCTHVQLYRYASRLLELCMERHGGDGQRLCLQCLVMALTAQAGKVRRQYMPKAEAKEKIAKARKRKKRAKKIPARECTCSVIGAVCEVCRERSEGR